jgi:hypothetical protein
MQMSHFNPLGMLQKALPPIHPGTEHPQTPSRFAEWRAVAAVVCFGSAPASRTIPEGTGRPPVQISNFTRDNMLGRINGARATGEFMWNQPQGSARAIPRRSPGLSTCQILGASCAYSAFSTLQSTRFQTADYTSLPTAPFSMLRRSLLLAQMFLISARPQATLTRNLFRQLLK